MKISGRSQKDYLKYIRTVQNINLPLQSAGYKLMTKNGNSTVSFESCLNAKLKI